MVLVHYYHVCKLFIQFEISLIPYIENKFMTIKEHKPYPVCVCVCVDMVLKHHCHYVCITSYLLVSKELNGIETKTTIST